MGEIINGGGFDKKRRELLARYSALDKKLESYKRLAQLGVFSVGRRIGNHPELESEVQKWVRLLGYSDMRELLTKAQQHRLTENDYNKLISCMEIVELWP
jgi:hypothetical protein